MDTASGAMTQTQLPDMSSVMGTYGRLPVSLVRGSGTRVWDADGREYLDFLAGIAVCGVGHCHPHVVDAISRQAATLMHVSNLFHNPLQPELAKRLCGWTDMERAFFANSGAEANECAIKIARKWGKARRGPECHQIVSFTGSFHGRTLATVTATAQPRYQAPFTPLPGGFVYVDVGDVEALDEAIGEETCAVILEPIQGESGVHVVPPEFLRLIRALCDEAEVLLIFDEVQSGMGRTGSFLASQRAGVQGDIVTLAKSVASGMPMGVCLSRGDAAETLVPGDHGSTFGGQPLACAAALATLDVIETESLMERARAVGGAFIAGLEGLRATYPEIVAEARGVGLMAALEFAAPCARQVQLDLLRGGIIVNAVGDSILRFLPPLTVTEEECLQVVGAISDRLEEMAAANR